MSDVNDNDYVFLSFELASCRGIGSSNTRHADSGGCEGNSESTSHNFSFRRVHRACWTPTLTPRFGRAPTRGTIRRSSVVAGSVRCPSSCTKIDGQRDAGVSPYAFGQPTSHCGILRPPQVAAARSWTHYGIAG